MDAPRGIRIKAQVGGMEALSHEDIKFHTSGLVSDIFVWTCCWKYWGCHLNSNVLTSFLLVLILENMMMILLNMYLKKKTTHLLWLKGYSIQFYINVYSKLLVSTKCKKIFHMETIFCTLSCLYRNTNKTNLFRWLCIYTSLIYSTSFPALIAFTRLGCRTYPLQNEDNWLYWNVQSVKIYSIFLGKD